jgi:hypothetical protein
MSYAGGCREYCEARGVDPNAVKHCGSCHADAEDGREMCSAEVDGVEYEVCCCLPESVDSVLPSPR